ncbi:MAG: hypothetical protein CMN30_07240 [Sandaracinus sp.]|nr:hypothetical protein [Sandaracinus sp.]|tara:strand:- start:134 stop:460 length:327 start_codon:yes stop_codon:yes gene_type:complete
MVGFITLVEWRRVFRDLHDAVLTRVELDWAAGEVTFVVHRVGDEASTSLTVVELRSVSIDRRLPWGPSSHINSVRIDAFPGAEGSVRVQFEMQSGDEIVVSGKGATER